MSHKCFISFKTEDLAFKSEIQSMAALDMIDKSLDSAIQSTNEDFIMQRIRQDYLADSTVTIHLIGNHSSESLGAHEQRFIKREMQASLYDGAGNTKNGILGVVLPGMVERIYRGASACSLCRQSHEIVRINGSTVVEEFSYNY